MSDGNPPDDMFGGLPFMADLMKLLQGQTSGSNDTARQLAHTIANDGQSEPNIDPADRIAVEQLIRVTMGRPHDHRLPPTLRNPFGLDE